MWLGPLSCINDATRGEDKTWGLTLELRKNSKQCSNNNAVMQVPCAGSADNPSTTMPHRTAETHSSRITSTRRQRTQSWQKTQRIFDHRTAPATDPVKTEYQPPASGAYPSNGEQTPAREGVSRSRERNPRTGEGWVSWPLSPQIPPLTSTLNNTVNPTIGG